MLGSKDKPLKILADEVKDKTIFEVDLPIIRRLLLKKIVPKDSKYKESYEGYLRSIARDLANELNSKTVLFFQVIDLYYSRYEAQMLIPKEEIPPKTDLRLLRLDIDDIREVTDLIRKKKY